MKDPFPPSRVDKKYTPTNISIKLKEYFLENGMKQSDIARVLDVTQAAVSGQLNGRPFGINAAKKWSKTFGFSIDWLTTGEGSMFTNRKPTNILKGDEHEIMGPKHHYNDELPVIPAWLFRAQNVDAYNIVMNDQSVETLPAIPHLEHHELFARCPGDAMAPKICKGYLMALAKLDADQAIVNGEIYAVDTYSQGIIVRRIIDNYDGTWSCYACDTDRFKPFDIKRSDVLHVFRVVGVLYKCTV
jgi:predicted XRE-type DNA-binding protein